MSTEKKVVIRIGPGAATSIEAFGFQGKGPCHAATKPYEDALGLDVAETMDKDEAFVRPEKADQVKAR